MAEKTDKKDSKAAKPESKKDVKADAKAPAKVEAKPAETKVDPDKAQSKIKMKGKNWYTILSPALFGQNQIGETLAREDPEVIGRKIDVGVPEVTNDPSKYYMKAVFEIDRVEAGRAYTKFSEIEVLKDYISRMVQRRVRRIDSFETLKTKDGVTVVVKTVGISIRRINNSMKSLVRAEIKNTVEEFVSKNTLDQILIAIINNKIQAMIRKAASKAYPLRACEIRRLQVLEYPQNFREETGQAPAQETPTQPTA